MKLLARLALVPASLCAVLATAGCEPQSVAVSGAASAALAADVEVTRSFTVAQGSLAGAVLWLHPQDISRSRIVAAEGDAGLASHALDGSRRESLDARASEFVAVTYGFDAGDAPGALLVAQDRAIGALRAYTIDPASGRAHELTRVPLALQAELTGLCLYRSRLSGQHYAFAVTDDGDLQQWQLSARKGEVLGHVVRRIPVGKGAAACAADDATGQLYLADESTGIWRLAAEPEADTTRELLTLAAPRGPLGETVKNIALASAGDAGYLLAADEDAARLHVLALPEGRHLGSVALAGIADAKLNALWATPFGDATMPGRILVADEGGQAPALRELRWDALVTALKLPAMSFPDPRVSPASSARVARPVVETQPVDDFGDAADDPAIWVHPVDPAQSLVISAQKKRGVEVYDLSGRRLQVLADGRTNNVDLRQGVLLGGRQRDIVVASNRESRTLALYEVDVRTRRLVNAAAAPVASGMRDPYGVCLYYSAKSGRLYAFMNNSDAGEFRQWEIIAKGNYLAATVVREFTVGSQAEGCAADDETGALYVAEEDAGLWRYEAEPDAGAARRQVDTTGEGGHLKADVEGVGIFRGRDGRDGRGWIVVSNQGDDNYAVYRREGDNAFVGHFSIVAHDALGIDGASETDGLEVTSQALGSRFPHGLLVVQDGRNLTPSERQNYKLVPWEQVAAALGLQLP